MANYILLKCWLGFTIGNIIYAGARYLITKSTGDTLAGDTLAIWWGATSMVLIIWFFEYLKK